MLDRRQSLGYLPDRRHLHGLPIRMAASVPGTPPPESMVVDGGVMSLLDQRAAPFCVSHGVSQALRACQVLNGVHGPRLASRLWIMYLAHAAEHDVLTFQGAIISDAFEAIEQLGFPPEEAWPYDDSPTGNYCVKPPMDVFRLAFDRRAPLDYGRIMTVGERRVNDIKLALAAGFPVVFGTQVTDAFCSGELGAGFTAERPKAGDAMAGGHCMMISGYAKDGRFRVVNSWGPGWGDGGKFWMAPEYIAWDGTEDVWQVHFSGRQP